MSTQQPIPADLVPPPLTQEHVDRIETEVAAAQRQALREGRPFDPAAVRVERLRDASRAHARQHAAGFAQRMGPPARRTCAMDLAAALRALSPEDLLLVAEALAPVIATIPTRSTIEAYRADGRVTVRFEMKLGGAWRDVGIYHATHGLSRTWVDPEPGCDRSAGCLARLHYEDCGAALWRRRPPDGGPHGPSPQADPD